MRTEDAGRISPPTYLMIARGSQWTGCRAGSVVVSLASGPPRFMASVSILWELSAGRLLPPCFTWVLLSWPKEPLEGFRQAGPHPW